MMAEPNKYDLVWEKDAMRSLLDRDERCVKELVSAFQAQLAFVNKTDNSRVDAFLVLSGDLVFLLEKHATAAAAAAKVSPVTRSDMLTWIAMYIYSESIAQPLDCCFRSLLTSCECSIDRFVMSKYNMARRQASLGAPYCCLAS